MRVIELRLQNNDENYVKMLRYKLAYISKDIVNISEEGASLHVHIEGDKFEEIEAALKRLVDELDDSYTGITSDILYEKQSQNTFPDYDIYQALVDQKWIVPYESGLIGFGREFLELFKLLDQMFVNWGKRFGAVEYVYPDLIGIETLNQYHYIEQFPNHLMFASHLREDLDLIQSFSEKVSAGCDCYDTTYIDKPQLMNKLAICPHVYKQYENQTIDLDEMLVVTSVGKCKRYESINMTKVERLLDFTMREIVLVGSYEHVIKAREECIRLAINFIDQLGLEANIKSANDPFFTTKYSPKAMLQQKLKLKYELNLLLPYNNKELSVGSFNYHGIYFTEAFNINSSSGANVHTGCIAFGLERFAYAILSQLGVDGAKFWMERQAETLLFS
ncbi:hypothetical protein BSK56_25905 [Paenibacillus borealis]|uniref:Aminoacyl-transfer RNA synthetases class-II family profile domain-containing protein n=1 Tax=Paenibacillus borealis TaxID=160799 RepID=A0ABX3H3Z8_PAEBO|nr:hypothetical protein [Paenibacillus borealis]OMD42331.1 hypothetical protein BSK56_25905 [Paenibacillus borealis]